MFSQLLQMPVFAHSLDVDERGAKRERADDDDDSPYKLRRCDGMLTSADPALTSEGTLRESIQDLIREFDTGENAPSITDSEVAKFIQEFGGAPSPGQASRDDDVQSSASAAAHC